MGNSSVMRLLHKRTEMVGRPAFHVEWLSKTPFLVERAPIELAAIRAKDGQSLAGKPICANTLKDCLLMHPRYVGNGIDHEIIKVRGWRNGRAIDILLDEPYIAEGKEFPILNFKGWAQIPTAIWSSIRPDGLIVSRPILPHPANTAFGYLESKTLSSAIMAHPL